MLTEDCYSIADYGRCTFSVHQTRWPAKPEKIVEISSTSSQALSHGSIAGAVIGGVAGLVALIIPALVVKEEREQIFGMERKAEIKELDAKDSTASGILHGHKSGTYEIDGEDYLGAETDGMKLPGHEIDGHHGHELADSVRRQEQMEAKNVKHEMPASKASQIELS